MPTGHGARAADRDTLARRGMAMVLLATIAWSFSGLFTRALTLDIPTTVTWRAFSGGLLLLLPWLYRRRADALHDLAALGRADWIAIGASIVAQAATTAGLFLTSVAHVAVIYASCPFIAAVIAWWWLGEIIGARTFVAIAVSAVGVVTVVAGSLGGGSLVGDAVALVMTTSFAMLIVLPKAYPSLRVLETMIVSAFMTFALFLPVSTTAGLDLRNGAIVAAYGSINLVLAYVLFIRGAQHIPAATSGLIATLEIVLSPFWVWLFLGEKIDVPTVVGGAVVAGAVVGHLLMSLRPEPSGHAIAERQSAGENG